MKNPKSKNSFTRKKEWDSEEEEIELLKSWIEDGKPDSGSNPLSIKPLPSDAPIGRLNDNSYSPYVGCKNFIQLPISQKTKDGLKDGGFTEMTDIQRASLPHALCGRDILGAAKTGSGKTLAFIISVLEKLYREKWGPGNGVGCIIITPTRELADQIFDVLKAVGNRHGYSFGLLIGGFKDVEVEKKLVNDVNILVCTPGRLLQHLSSGFVCPDLQVLVLDEADRILDIGFKKELNAIISYLPEEQQTLLFSATQTKSVQDLARLSLKDPEYLSVHKESVAATPSLLQQVAMIVPLDQKLDMLWSFIKSHLTSKIIVFLSTCKQVKFVYETFKKLRPGIPLKCLHGHMKQERRMGIYSQFCEKRSVLFSTDVASRGLDFNKAVDWVVQVDCPEDAKSYIHRVGRTARYHSKGNSVLFLMPSEEEMLKKLHSAKVPVKVVKAQKRRLQTVSELLAALLVKYPDMQYLAQRAFITYLKCIHKQQDKEVFDVRKLPMEEFSASLGLPMTPKIRFLQKKTRTTTEPEEVAQQDITVKSDVAKTPRKKAGPAQSKEEKEELEKVFLLAKEAQGDGQGNGVENEAAAVPETRILKKKKLKINVHRPVGTRVVFDEEGNTLPPLAMLADSDSGNGLLQLDKVKERYAKLKEEMKQRDKEDKALLRQRLREKRTKEKMKLKRSREKESDEEDEEISGSDKEESGAGATKRSKIYFDNDNEGDEKDNLGFNADSISLAEQEALALKLLSSMHS